MSPQSNHDPVERVIEDAFPGRVDSRTGSGPDQRAARDIGLCDNFI